MLIFCVKNLNAQSTVLKPDEVFGLYFNTFVRHDETSLVRLNAYLKNFVQDDGVYQNNIKSTQEQEITGLTNLFLSGFSDKIGKECREDVKNYFTVLFDRFKTATYTIRNIETMRNDYSQSQDVSEVFYDVMIKVPAKVSVIDFKNGKKMSKSTGNVINPLQMLSDHGTDALRLSMIMGITPGNDLKIYEEKIKAFRNFSNKLWNIARYILTKTQNSPPKADPRLRPASDGQASRAEKFTTQSLKPKTLSDLWILSELNTLITNVQAQLDNYQYGSAAEALMEFTWNKFADWYLEMSKAEEGKEGILRYILETLLKLWHPFIPFVTEYIWAQTSDELLLIAEYPMPAKISKEKLGKQAKTLINQLQKLIIGIRNLRAEYRLEPKKNFACYIDFPKSLSWIQDQTPVIEKLAYVKLNFSPIEKGKKMPYLIWQDTKVFLVIPNFDPKKEKGFAEKELKKLSERLDKLSVQLSNRNFLKKAPGTVVEKLKNDYQEAGERAEHLVAKLKTLK